MKSKILYGVAALLLVLSVVFFFTGKHKKDNYMMSDYSFQKDVNAYVGGDAYNYIINGTYFSGYMAAAAGSLVAAAILVSSGTIIATIENIARKIYVPDEQELN